MGQGPLLLSQRDNIVEEENEYVAEVTGTPLFVPPPPSSDDDDSDDEKDIENDEAVRPTYDQVVSAQTSRSIEVLNSIPTTTLNPQTNTESTIQTVVVNGEDVIERTSGSNDGHNGMNQQATLPIEPDWSLFKASTTPVQVSDFVKQRTPVRYGFVVAVENRKLTIFWFDTQDQGFSSKSKLYKMISKQ